MEYDEYNMIYKIIIHDENNNNYYELTHNIIKYENGYSELSKIKRAYYWLLKN